MDSRDSILCQGAIKAIRTTMIGAISKFENRFGYLWNHFNDDPLTEEQEKFADLWDFTRNEILNQGNKQIRRILQEHQKLFGPPIQTVVYHIQNENPYDKEG